jgi:hypothetical protein
VEEIRPVYRDSHQTVGERIVRTWVAYDAEAITPWDALMEVGERISAEEAS